MTTDSQPDEMFAPERRQRITEIVRRVGRVDVTDLSNTFKVTTETVRRDLNQLESHGLLRRVHGGAVPVDRLPPVPDVIERSTSMLAEKRAIARAALADVPDDGAVLLDAGTTTARLADIFPGDRDLTVVTNSLPIAESLQDKPRLTVMILGGTVGPRTRATSATWALNALAEISVDVAFLATTGISVRRGLTTGDPSDAAVKRAMAAAAGRVVLLADHSKVGVERLCIVSSLSSVDRLVTDAGVTAAELDNLASAGLEVVVAGPLT